MIQGDIGTSAFIHYYFDKIVNDDMGKDGPSDLDGRLEST